jgi:hypothetical protein
MTPGKRTIGVACGTLLLVLVLVSPASAGQTDYAAEVLADNPVQYLILDDAAHPAQDSSGNDFDIANTQGTFAYQTDEPFDGASSVQIGPPGANALWRGAVSGSPCCDGVEFWIKRLGTSDFHVDAGLNGGLSVRVNSAGEVQGILQGVGFLSVCTGTVDTDEWHYIGLFRRSGTWECTVFGPGVGQTTNVGTGAPPAPNTAMQLRGQNVHISNVAIYETAISMERVEARLDAASAPQQDTACNNGEDDDDDGFVDLLDPGCTSPADGSEFDGTSEEGGQGTFLGGLTGGILSILRSILCAIQNLALSILAVIVMAFNAVIKAIATLLAGLLRVLPDFPDLPTLPVEFETASAWMAWVFPVGTVVAIVAWFAVVWLVWQGVALGLRWAKATSQ